MLKHFTIYNKNKSKFIIKENAQIITLPEIESLSLSQGRFDLFQIINDNSKLENLNLNKSNCISFYTPIKEKFACSRLKKLVLDCKLAVDNNYQSVASFLLCCNNLESFYIDSVSAEFVTRIISNINQFKHLWSIGLFSKDSITLLKEDFNKIRECNFLQSIMFSFDWMKEENDIYMLFDAVKECTFLYYILVGYINEKWSYYEDTKLQALGNHYLIQKNLSISKISSNY